MTNSVRIWAGGIEKMGLLLLDGMEEADGL